MKLSKEEQIEIEQLLNDSPTRCIGTYLIDLPRSFKATDMMSFYYQDDKVKIYTWNQYLPPFKQLLAKREQTLRLTQPVNPINGNFLKKIYPIYIDTTNDYLGTIFERMESQNVDDVARVLEGYLWQSNVTIKIEIKATNGIAERYNEMRALYPASYENTVPEVLTTIKELFKKIEARDDLVIPNKAGICLLGSFMNGVDKEWKDIEYDYFHDSVDDFYFNFSYNDYIEDVALLDYPEIEFTDDNGYTVYNGLKESNGLKMEEWVVKGQFFEDDESEIGLGYIFTLAINMTTPTYDFPNLIVKMYYKIPDDIEKMYSEEQLISVWQNITNTIRVRQPVYERDA